MDARFAISQGLLLPGHYLIIIAVIFLRIWFSKFPGDDSYFIGYSVFSVASVFLNVAFSA